VYVLGKRLLGAAKQTMNRAVLLYC